MNFGEERGKIGEEVGKGSGEDRGFREDEILTKRETRLRRGRLRKNILDNRRGEATDFVAISGVFGSFFGN